MSPLTLQRSARLSRLPGICLALALGSVAYAGIDCGVQSNCQLPDIENFPGGVILTSASTQDNFVPLAGGNITGVCWWGAYIDGPAGGQFDCGPGPGDNFTITYYNNAPGCPTGAPADVIASFNVVATKAATGLEFLLGGFADPVAEYAFSASHPAVPVAAGTCYWIEVSNVTVDDCNFFWEVSPLGPGDGAISAGAVVEWEMAWCIDLELDPDTSVCVLEINPACEGAKGPCGGPHDSPGCEDACCCTLVCDPDMGGDPSCCIFEWDEQCVNRALDLGCATLPPCQAEVNCQVFDVVNAFNSTGGDVFISADDFTPLANGSITDICWYGVYSAGTPADDFTVRYYDDASGLPGTVIAAFSQAGGTLIGLTREITGADIGGAPIFVYSATHAGAPVEAGVCYWIEITNPNDASASWFWSFAQDGQGNGRMALDGTPPDGFTADDAIEQDLAFCLGLELSPPACGLELLFDTGPHRTVLFNGAASHLGWSSGKLNTTNDQQRRTAQAFTLPAVPAGTGTWNIAQLSIEGFDPGGVANEIINFEIFTRVALDQAPGPGDVVASGQVGPFPLVFGEVAAIRINDDGVPLPPGDYWLTMWASNPADGLANFAWFTNAEFGINNFCTLDAPPPAAGYTGCEGNDPNGDPPGSPMMLRARLYPDPGFGAYTLDPSVLDVFDKAQDPADLYNASFRVRGTVSGNGAPPCPADFDLSGAVDVKDLLFLLGAWGPCPKQGDCPADFDLSGAVDVKDLLFLLGAWGPCPL